MTIGGDAVKKWQEHSFVIDNAHEAIVENRFAHHDESESIFKMKRQKKRMKSICDR